LLTSPPLPFASDLLQLSGSMQQTLPSDGPAAAAATCLTLNRRTPAGLQELQLDDLLRHFKEVLN